MTKLNANFIDIFKAPRIALSLQKMWIQFIGLFWGYLGYALFIYLGYLTSGFNVSQTWQKYGLLICPFSGGESFAWHSWILFTIGIVILFFVYLISSTAVARSAYMSTKGNAFYSWKEAFAFARKKAVSIVMTPISLLMLVGLIVLGLFFVGLLGKVPFVGELGVGLFTIIWFLAALVIIFFAMVSWVAFLFVPSIIATTDEDAFEAVFQSFSILWNQPVRMIGYLIQNIVVSLMAVFVFAAILKKAIIVMNGLLSAFVGADFINLANNGQSMVQSWLLYGQQLVESLLQQHSGFVYFSNEFILIPTATLSSSVVLASYFYASSLLFIAAWVLSYLLSSFTAGNMLSYLVIRQIKDGENLLERIDREEEEEEEVLDQDDSSEKRDQENDQ